MKKIVLIFSLTLFYVISLSQALDVYADGDVNSKSGVNITITERTLSLDDVSVPTFKPTVVTNEKITLSPTNDFSVTVSDKRDELRHPWTLYYNVSVFSNNNGEAVPEQQFSVGKGTIEGISNESYEASDVNVTPDATEPMLRVDESTKTTYKYTVPKDDVSLSFGANAKAGDYVAKQTLWLASLPALQ